MTKISPKQTVLLLALAVLSFLIYESPSDNKWTNNTEGAIKRASLFAGYIRNGQKNELAAFATPDRLKSDAMPSMMDVAVWSELRENMKPPMHHYLWRPAVADFADPGKSVQLMMLERKGGYFVLTFAGLIDERSSNTIYKDGKPMIVSVAIQYLPIGEDNLFKLVARKFFNLDWMPDLLKKNGEKGDWIILEYSYSFTTREYYDWVKKNGGKLYAEAEVKKVEAMKTIRDVDFMRNFQENIEKRTDALFYWIEEKLKSQAEIVGRQLQLENPSFLIDNTLNGN